MLELFVEKIHFFKFLSMSNKPLEPAEKYYCYSYIVQASLNCSIRARKGKYPVLKINTKFHQLIKHAKIFLLLSFTGIMQIFVRDLPKSSKPSHLKAEASRYLKTNEPC